MNLSIASGLYINLVLRLPIHSKRNDNFYRNDSRLTYKLFKNTAITGVAMHETILLSGANDEDKI